MAKIVIPPPPRLQGPAEEQISQLNNYSQQLYGALVEVARAVAAVGQIAPYTDGASNPPTQAEVVAIAQKSNEIIAAAGAVTL